MPEQQKKQSKLVIPAMHSPLQTEYLGSLAPISAACFGTKWGKTFSTAAWFAARLWTMQTGTSLPHWYVAPIYKQSKIAQRLVMNMLPKDRAELIQSQNLIRVFNADGSIHSIGEFRSAKNPNDLQGEGIATGVFDEADRASAEAWNSFYTTATITQAPIKVISSPVRRGWFYDLWLKGTAKYINAEQRARLLRGDYTASVDGVVSFNGPTADNPYVPRHVIERAKATLPEKAFRAYYLAQFPESGGVVFGNIDQCFDPAGTFEPPLTGHRYVLGSDLGKHRDFTVCFVMDVTTRRIVWREKWKDLDWNTTARKIIELGELYNFADIIIDATGVGDPVLDNMVASGTGCEVQGFKFTNQSKRPLVENLVLGFDKQDLILPGPDCADTKEELEYFGFEITDSGNIRYEAEEGHDDEVFSLALCYWWVTNQITPGVRILNVRQPKQGPPTAEEEAARIKQFMAESEKKFKDAFKEEIKRLLNQSLGSAGHDEENESIYD
jgi:hypothetical protein